MANRVRGSERNEGRWQPEVTARFDDWHSNLNPHTQVAPLIVSQIF